MARPREHSTAPVEYSTAHQRVVRYRGRAKDHVCAHCGSPAHTWAWGHRGLEQTQVRYPDGPNGRSYMVTYSSDPADYDPLCYSCHRRYDLGH